MQTTYVTDSTGHGYNASSIPTAPAIAPISGIIGTALRFNSAVVTDNRILISQSLRLTNQTLSAWIWLDNASHDGVVMTKEGQMFFWQQGTTLRFETAPWGGDTPYAVTSAGGVSNWIHFAAVQNGLQATMYINGTAVGNWTKASAPVAGTEWFCIGGGWNRRFQGRIDECRAENSPRSAAWIRACYQNQIAPETFLDFEAAPNVLNAEATTGANLHLSWPARGESLQTSPLLAENSFWTTNGLPTPTFDGESNHVMVPMAGDASFFRLAAPKKDFQMQLSSGNLIVTQGLADSVVISVVGVNGFSNTVSITASNMPAGVTAYLLPASLKSGTSVLTLDALVTAAPGTYPVTVTGTGGLVSHSTNLMLTIAAGAAGAAYVWPSYSPNLDYNFTNEYAAINAPSNILNDCSGVTTTITIQSNWFCFRFGAGKHSIVTSNAWIPMLHRLNTDFIYFRDIMGWPPDKRAKRGYFSSVYLLGSGTCVGGASNDLGGWQGNINYNGESWPMVLLSYYPVYSYDPACPYPDRLYQRDAVVHEAIHSVLADMPGCKQSCWFHEGGNTWLQGTAKALQTGNYSSMGWLSAGQMIAPFMPIECYSGWLQDDSFGGPCAEGVNMFSNSVQICTWRNLLGGTQYGETFPHFMGEIVSQGSVAWIWRYCTNRVLEGLAAPNGLGEYQTRRLIREFRARQVMCDFGQWSGAYTALLNNNWGASIEPEWEPYWINAPVWTARCYVVTTNDGGTLTPERRTLPGWSGANQIPLTTISATGNVTVNFSPLGTNMSCQLVYRATDNSIIYGLPVSSGPCSLTPPAGKAIKNNVVVAVICNTDFRYNGESSRTNKFDYRLTITGGGASGVSGPANIATQWYQ
jgi:hypothetical protein